jgi:hypothetical protein
MNTCEICNNQHEEEDLTEIGLGTNKFQCEKCWINYGEETENA